MQYYQISVEGNANSDHNAARLRVLTHLCKTNQRLQLPSSNWRTISSLVVLPQVQVEFLHSTHVAWWQFGLVVTRWSR